MNERILKCSMLNDFMIHLCEDEKSHATIEKYMRDMRKFKEFTEGRNVDKQLVLDYKEHLDKCYAVASAN